MDDSTYEVLPLPVNLFGEIDKENEDIKPFVAAYFPAELLTKMGWTRKTPLNVTIDGETLIICKKELQYELEPETEPDYL